MSKAGGEAAADGDKKFIVSRSEEQMHLFEIPG